ncbi:MAG: DUF302 domain-containing protein, partial [Rhizobiaceae bacterium]|nr:DUF302 domain-containing protein [Rhizobiaceae bacterium]
KSTLDRLADAVSSRGMKIFARIDFAADAAGSDMSLPATELLVFGNPKVGTLLLQKKQLIGIDLPLKALAWASSGDSWLAYNEPSYIATRHEVGLDDTVAKMTAALRSAAEEAVAIN